jgi:hypothetical protein
LFANVLKKFFTDGKENENKGATDTEFTMTTIKSLKSIATRAQDTLLQDAVGAAALLVMLVVSLHLPSFV